MQVQVCSSTTPLLKQSINVDAAENINIGGGGGLQNWPGTGMIDDELWQPWLPADPWIPPVDPPRRMWPAITVVSSGYAALTPWRHVVNTDSIDLWVDVPGVKVQDLSIDIDMGKLRVSAARADTKASIKHVYVLTDMFDPATATAMLEDGVLNINVKKRPESMPRKVKVKVK